MIVVVSGELVVLKTIDGVEFKIAKLRRGSVLNYHNVLYNGEISHITLKSSSRSTIMILPQERLHDISESSSELFR